MAQQTEKGTLKVHTENLLPIIKKWLYSDKDIFLRELVSNACDALSKVKFLHEQGEISELGELRIDIALDKSARTLTISDTGIGMSAEEVEKYIAQIAFSGAEEFLGKYKDSGEKEQIIGHFGLGFYSAYMVSSKVEIDTLSYKESSEAAFWSCDGSSEYELGGGTRAERGTTLTLFIDKESDEYLDEKKILQMLQRYCSFLPFPIFLNSKRINEKEPLWVKAPSDCTEEEYLDFYHTLYPAEPDPIFWVHVNVDYPFHLKGILYFPTITRRFDWQQNAMKLFCNRVFVSENCKDLIPDYLTALRGAIDSPDIPLNVSRSYLQMDRTVRQLSSHISKKIADKLASLYETEKEKFLEAWKDIESIVKLGILQDEKFYERSKPFLVWKNLDHKWISLESYTDTHKDTYKNKVFYTSDEHAPFLDLYKQKGIEVLLINNHIDTALIHFLEGKLAPIKFQRVDGNIDAAILDTERENTLLDENGKTLALKMADFIKAELNLDKVEVEAKSLASDTLPGFIVVDEEMRRTKDYMALTGQTFPIDLPEKKTFVINTNCKLVSKLYALKDKDPALASQLALHLYETALLAQKELPPSALPTFITRATALLEKILN